MARNGEFVSLSLRLFLSVHCVFVRLRMLDPSTSVSRLSFNHHYLYRCHWLLCVCLSLHRATRTPTPHRSFDARINKIIINVVRKRWVTYDVCTFCYWLFNRVVRAQNRLKSNDRDANDKKMQTLSFDENKRLTQIRSATAARATNCCIKMQSSMFIPTC